MKIVVRAFLTCFLLACSSRPVPSDVLEPEKMKLVIYDLMQADEYINVYLLKDTSINLNTKRSTLYDGIFKIHDTNRKDFFSSYKYYQQHPDVQKALYDSLTKFLERTKNEKYKQKYSRQGKP